jgi:hypothetical protein
LDEAEVAAPEFRFLEDLRAEDVGRHQVRRELHPTLLQAEHRAERLDEPRLAQAGHADEQQVAAREQRYQRFVDNPVLSEDDPADRLPRAGDLYAELIYAVDERRIIALAEVCHLAGCHRAAPAFELITRIDVEAFLRPAHIPAARRIPPFSQRRAAGRSAAVAERARALPRSRHRHR